MKRIKGHIMAAMMTLFGRNWITMSGATLSATSALLIIGFMLVGLLPITHSPYLGIIAFMILPGVFVFGLLVVPVGALWERYKSHQAGYKARGDQTGRFPFPRIDLNDAHTRHVAMAVVVITAFNLIIISLVSYEGLHYTESVEFCGKVCHAVMKPESTAHSNSPHSRVECVECHIGPGAPWFVRSKLSGLGQVFAVVLGNYERPIPTPVENLRPSRDTCEQCHWPQQFTGDRVKVITKFLDDEQNTKVQTVLLMHIGGGAAGGPGIHSWHINPEKRTTYLALDRERQDIALVRFEADGKTTEFVKEGFDASFEATSEEMRVMDCIDCHNRPTHIYRLPDTAMDLALSENRIDASLPYIKSVGVEALTAAEGAEGAEGDLEQIEKHIRNYYQENYTELLAEKGDAIQTAIEQIQSIYNHNVFPDMKVTWGTYPNNIGHQKFPGCFRCHDDSHTSKDGQTIKQDCTICHTILAWEEENPEVLPGFGSY